MQTTISVDKQTHPGLHAIFRKIMICPVCVSRDVRFDMESSVFHNDQGNIDSYVVFSLSCNDCDFTGELNGDTEPVLAVFRKIPERVLVSLQEIIRSRGGQ